MQVFHYCAEILKGTPLFETCSDDHILKPNKATEGAIYNDFDGNNNSLVDDEDFESWIQTTNTQNNDDTERMSDQSLEVPTVSQNDIDFYFLQSDEANETRWVKDHPLFHSDKTDPGYSFDVKHLISMPKEAWDKLPITEMDLER